MTLEGIISIAGRPGLFKVITKGKNSVIVESLIDSKRFPITVTQNISALNEIAIYTYEEEIPLRIVLKSMGEKENGKG